MSSLQWPTPNRFRDHSFSSTAPTLWFIPRWPFAVLCWYLNAGISNEQLALGHRHLQRLPGDFAYRISTATARRGPPADRRHAGRSSLHFLAPGIEETEPGLRRSAGRYLLDPRRTVLRQQASRRRPAF